MESPALKQSGPLFEEPLPALASFKTKYDVVKYSTFYTLP
jgi:hypothetical protein